MLIDDFAATKTSAGMGNSSKLSVRQSINVDERDMGWLPSL